MDEQVERAAVRDAFDRMHDADRRFSRYLPDSEVSRYDGGGRQHATCARSSASRSASASSPAAPSRVRRPDGSLDTDGVVKGWAAQRAADTLTAAGLTTFCLNAGGDVVVRGEPEPGRGWNVGVRDPSDPQSFLTVLEVRDGAVATSGTYERGEHVWDGRTGQAATGLRSATVVAADLTTADVLATCVLALGPDGIAWAAQHGAAAVLAVDADGELLTALQAAPA